MKGMRAGLMRNQVVIEQLTPSGTYAGAEGSWTPVATVWAEIEPLVGRELEIASAMSPDTTHRVTMRYYAGLDTSYRLLIGGSRIFNIDGVLDIENRGRQHTVNCHEEK